MITVEDKLRTFSKYVYEKQVKESDKVIKEAEEENELTLATKKKELAEKYDRHNEKAMERAEMESQKIISKAKLDAKEDLLSVKKELLDQFMDEISQYFKTYTEGKGYAAYMKELLEDSNEYLLEPDVKVYLIQRDVKRFSEGIKDHYPNAEILAIDDENIGGFIIESIAANQRIDRTILRKIFEYKSEIGIRLYEALEE